MATTTEILHLYFAPQFDIYKDASDFVDWYNDKHEYENENRTGAFASVTVNGISVYGTLEQIESAIAWCCKTNKIGNYCVQTQHPEESKREIIEALHQAYQNEDNL